MIVSGVTIDAAALEEANTAVEWYKMRSPQAAGRFLEQLDLAIRRIVGGPRVARKRQGFRHVLVRTFPYAIIYRFDHGSILIVAIAHTSRRSGYWLGR